ncbi:MAG: hypothetical protein H3C35_08645, partial [Bacteroidetes bacterium]|nr:hypothetical protein [Bacteroidota bacterium]
MPAHFETLRQSRKNKTAVPASSRPLLQTSRRSPSGNFRIHFDTTGSNTPALLTETGNRIPGTYSQFVDSAAAIFDMVYKKEVQEFQFPAPPSDAGRGDGGEYDIYIIEYGSQLIFGETVPESDYPISPQKTNTQYPTYIQIDNDFGSGYRTMGMLALRATAAHEYFHAIQVGNYGLWEDDSYFYELTAEAMENTVFREAKDYLFDLKTYYSHISSIPLFTNANNSLSRGYERAIFGIFLMKKFGVQAMREVWNAVALERPVAAVQTALNNLSTTIEREYVDFSLWNFYTGDRTVFQTKYFDDAEEFSPLAMTERALTASTVQIASTLQAFATSYVKVFTGSDSAYIILSNINYGDVKKYLNNVYG